MESFYPLILLVIVLAVAWFVLKSIVQLAVLGVVGVLLFTVFFGSGSGIVSAIAPFFGETAEQRIEAFYQDFRERTEGNDFFDADEMVAYAKDGLLGFVEETDWAEIEEKLRDAYEEGEVDEKIREILDQFSDDVDDEYDPEN